MRVFVDPPWSPKSPILPVAIGSILGTHSRDVLPGLERSPAGVVMKFLALGFGLLCVLLVSMRLFRMVRLDTFRNTNSRISSLTASPKMLPQRASGSELDLPAGTVVSVTLADPIDSDDDPFGKQYAASVKIVEGQAIAPGSRATVSLLHNNTGWLTQLTGLTINGRKFQVFSGAGSVVATQQDSKASPSRGVLEQVGFALATEPVSDQRILLPPATQLRFVLIGGTTPARADTASPRHTPAARMVTAPACRLLQPSPPPCRSRELRTSAVRATRRIATFPPSTTSRMYSASPIARLSLRDAGVNSWSRPTPIGSQTTPMRLPSQPPGGSCHRPQRSRKAGREIEVRERGSSRNAVVLYAGFTAIPGFLACGLHPSVTPDPMSVCVAGHFKPL